MHMVARAITHKRLRQLDQGNGFSVPPPHAPNGLEQRAELEAYLADLKKEVQAVEERLADLKK